MVLKSLLLRLMLVVAALVSCGAFASITTEGWHPLATLASLLPLQLAALFWALCVAPKAAVRPPAALMPPASAGSAPAGGSAAGWPHQSPGGV